MKTRRHGYALIECLTVIAMVGVTLGTIATTLHAMYRTDRGLREQLAFCSQVDRLASQLRGDAHQASSATVRAGDGEKGEATILALVLPGERTVEYSLKPPVIERAVRRGQIIEHRESHRLLGSATAQWHMEDGRAAPLVSLDLKLRANRLGDRAFTKSYRISATLRVVSSALKSPRT